MRQVTARKVTIIDYDEVARRVKKRMRTNPEEDVHCRTAQDLFGVTADAVTDPMRRMGKFVNHVALYGGCR